MAILGVSAELSERQLDQLIRQRTYENVKDTQETLQSIIALVNQIENMPVGQDVKGDVQNSLNALDEVSAKLDSLITIRFLTFS